jgi:hypothetical protein
VKTRKCIGRSLNDARPIALKRQRVNTCFDKLLSGKPFKIRRIIAYMGEAYTGACWEADTEEESVNYAKTLQQAFDQYDREKNPSRMMMRLRELHGWRIREGHWDEKRAHEAIMLVFWLEDRGYIKNDSVNGVIAMFDLDGQVIWYDRDPDAPRQIADLMRRGAAAASMIFVTGTDALPDLN